MKVRLLFTLILCTSILTGYTQSNDYTTYPKYPMYHGTDDMSVPFAYATEGRDTLYLATNSMGQLTRDIWHTDSATFKGIIPVFIWKDPTWFADIPQRVVPK